VTQWLLGAELVDEARGPDTNGDQVFDAADLVFLLRSAGRL